MATTSFTGFFLPVTLILLSFLCLARGLIWLFSEARHAPSLKGRLQSLADQDGTPSQGILLRLTASRNSFIEQVIQNFRLLRQLQTLLLQADVSWKPGSFVLLVLLGAGAALSLGFWQWGPLGGGIAAGLALYLPYRLLLFKKRRRIAKFEKQLPDALDLLARGLKAGHGFPAGLQLVAKEMAKPLGAEFYKTYKEYSHGLDLSLALGNMCQRITLRDLDFFTTAVMIQRETGGNLALILEKIATLIRERFKLRNQIQALTAEGRLSGVILILLPPVIMLILIFLNPKYEMQLIRHPLGRLMAMVALGFQAIGMWLIRKIVNIKV